MSEAAGGDLEGFAGSLATRTFGKPCHFFAQLDSTNTAAVAMAQAGAPEGTLVLAETQTQGRGRLGRSWAGEPGKSLLFSLILRPALAPSRGSQVTLLFAVAVARAVRRLSGLPAEIKWPNDVLVHGRKVCGILLEMQGQSDLLDFVVVGVGVNAAQESGWFPPELRDRATSLSAEGGSPVSRRELLAGILLEAEGLYADLLTLGFDAILQPWQSLSCMTGRQVRVEAGHRVYSGMAIGLDPDGALQVRQDNGVVERLVAGEVTLVRHTPTFEA